MAFLVLAYPELSSEDYSMIQEYRKDHDALHYNVVEPHFTIVFSVPGCQEEIFIREIKERARNFEAFDFNLRCAAISKDAFNEYYHTFLVPDEGNSNIIRLHDALYSGMLRDNLRLDLDFIPHIGIGNSKDKLSCKKMADEWNKKDFSIKGTISRLSIVSYNNKRVTRIAEIDLNYK